MNRNTGTVCNRRQKKSNCGFSALSTDKNGADVEEKKKRNVQEKTHLVKCQKRIKKDEEKNFAFIPSQNGQLLEQHSQKQAIFNKRIT